MLLSSGIDGPRVHAINVYVFSARASLVSPLACFLGFSYSLTSRFMVAFTSGRVVVTLPPETVALASRVLRYNWTSKEDSWLGRGTQRNRS